MVKGIGLRDKVKKDHYFVRRFIPVYGQSQEEKQLIGKAVAYDYSLLDRWVYPVLIHLDTCKDWSENLLGMVMLEKDILWLEE